VDAESGLITSPEPEAVAEGIDRLWELPERRLREMGEAGRARVAGITWDHVLDRLTETLR
jgi:glycosyltransferase involved in cell wall biosynthesis